VQGEIRKPDPYRDLVKGLRKRVKVLVPWFCQKRETPIPRETIITQNRFSVFTIFKFDYEKTFGHREDVYGIG
jgi:hypothetical protein